MQSRNKVVGPSSQINVYLRNNKINVLASYQKNLMKRMRTGGNGKVKVFFKGREGNFERKNHILNGILSSQYGSRELDAMKLN